MAHVWSCAVLWFVFLFVKSGFAIDELLQDAFPDINKINDNKDAVHQNKKNYIKDIDPLKLPSLADFAQFRDNDKVTEKEVTEETDNGQEHVDMKRQFNRNSDASFRRQNKFRTVGSSFSSSNKFGNRTSKLSPGGGCSRPQNLKNLKMVCTATTGCKLTCAMRYQFPTGHTELILTCKNATWHVENTNYDIIPSCEPICLPPCQNNGICIEPDKCECPENYSGLQCQYEKRLCLNMPPPIANAHRQCNAKNCKVMCSSGHQFPDGSQVATLICKEGEWVPARSDWVRVPDCQAICSPPCQNGGQCLTTNLCVCPQAYTGPECQYCM